jgi:hypothetical protein
MRTAKRETDDIVVLLVSAGPHTACTLNTALKVDRDGRMRDISHRLITFTEAAMLYLIVITPMVEL